MAKDKLKECKTCGATIAASAKVCPHCGAKQKRGHLVRNIIIVLAVLVVAVALFGGGNDDADDVASNNSAASAGSGAQVGTTGGTAGGDIAYEVTYSRYTLYESFNDIYCGSIIEVENTGSANLYLGSAKIDLYDADMNLVGVGEGVISSAPNIIVPGEKGYFYGAFSIDGSVSVDREYSVNPTLDIERAKHNPAYFELSDVSVTVSGEDSVDLIGKAANTTTQDGSLERVEIIYFTEDGTPILGDGVNVLNVSKGETQSFSTSSSGFTRAGYSTNDIADYKVYCCLYQPQL